MRLLCHEQQAMIAEQGHPVSRLGIWLGERTDQRVAGIAEPLTRRGMKLGDQLASMALDAWGDLPAVSLDEVHDEQGGVGVMHLRNGQLRMAGKLAEHVSLKLQI